MDIATLHTPIVPWPINPYLFRSTFFLFCCLNTFFVVKFATNLHYPGDETTRRWIILLMPSTGHVAKKQDFSKQLVSVAVQNHHLRKYASPLST